MAKLIGQIYRSMGLLSKGQVVCMDRTTLVGPYIGHTEEKMLEVLEKARGNVLFIDEAYALCDSTSDRKDFGNHVIEALLPILAEPN
ncbi:AAA family ATPase, partial [Klebsiella pneumoniae]|uniref:AAA family ATPase n=1 Tax=Klebsiella pneumoniae TaxID=573 RepID=UPI00259FEB46